MTVMNITGKEYYLDKIFNNDFNFIIPRFQRPYSWTKEETEELFDDLWSACFDETSVLENKEPYFLGSMVLIKSENKPDSQVIDGQQRITTLTILFSVLRFLISDTEFSGAITRFLQQDDNPVLGLKGEYRLTIREKDSIFFRDHIQNKDGLNKLFEIQHKNLPNDPKHNIWENATCLHELLKDKKQDDLILFTRYVIQKCIMVVVSTPNLDSAYKIFSVMNDRGLDLTNSDILKAEIIGGIANEKEQETYERKWVDLEESLKRELFNDLFAHIRMIYQKKKAKTDILKEFRETIKPDKNPKGFIDNILVPCGDMFSVINQSNFKSNNNAEKINSSLFWLNKIDNADWIPPAIVGMKNHQNDTMWLEQFFKKLERLTSIMFINRVNINERLDRFGKILTELEQGQKILANLEPTKNECSKALEILGSDIYDMPKISKYVLLRLDSLLAGEGAIYNYPVISIEHVLPQNPKQGSKWLEWFPNEEDREVWTHRLGNLVLLARKKNQEAQNYEFGKKINTYFKKDDISPFVLTTQVLNEEQWTIDVVSRRQNNNINKLKKLWEL